MIKTTVYLPEELKASLERLAQAEQSSEAEIIRRSIQATVDRQSRPRPRIPLTDRALGDSTVADNVDRFLDGFGER